MRMITTFTASLEGKKQLNGDTYLFTFKHTDSQFQFKAGQYVILHIPVANGQPARRLYSMASLANIKDTFELIVEIIPNGVASEYLMKMNPGETITVQGPAGMFTLSDTPRDIVFLATGTGIAPMISMIYSLLEQNSNKKLILFWGLHMYQDVYMLPELVDLHKKHPNFSFYNCLSRETSLDCVTNQEYREFHELGRVNKAFEKYVTGDVNNYEYYICGGQKVVDSLKEYLAEKNIPKEQIHFEKFTV